MSEYIKTSTSLEKLEDTIKEPEAVNLRRTDKAMAKITPKKGQTKYYTEN